MVGTYCIQERELEVEITEKINASIDGEEVYCERDQLSLSADGRGDLEAFRWIGPQGEVGASSLLEIPVLTDDMKGSYMAIIDNGACKDTAHIEVEVLPAPTLSLPSDITTDFCERLVINSQVNSALPVELSWDKDADLSCYNCPNPEVFFPILPTYELHATSVNGCLDSAEVNVILDKEKLIYIPNIFSPNAASLNNDFTLTPGCGVNRILKLEVYNRWGRPVHQTGAFLPDDNQNYWDGLLNGRIADAGVYVYFLELELADGEIVEMFGDVTLVP